VAALVLLLCYARSAQSSQAFSKQAILVLFPCKPPRPLLSAHALSFARSAVFLLLSHCYFSCLLHCFPLLSSEHSSLQEFGTILWLLSLNDLKTVHPLLALCTLSFCRLACDQRVRAAGFVTDVRPRTGFLAVADVTCR
jgi:hypothetical protein